MQISLAEITRLVGGRLQGAPDCRISSAAPFDEAAEDQITWAGSAPFLKRINQCRAGAVIVPADFKAADRPLIRVANPQLAFVRVLHRLYPSKKPTGGISSNACVGADFTCGGDVSIAPGAVIGDGVTIGERVTIYPNAVIGDRVRIGDDVVIYPNVTILERCVVGNRVVLHAGTVVGSDGFGFAPDGESYTKIPQLGIVQIDDDVEIGANNTIDRAAFGRTRIGRGVKTDNLVHIAHNVTVGENSVLVAQVGIAGSTHLGRHVIVAGQAGIAGHIAVGDHAVVGPQAGVSKSVADGRVVSGTPEMPHRQWLRVQRIVSKLPELKKTLEKIDKRLQKIETLTTETGQTR